MQVVRPRHDQLGVSIDRTGWARAALPLAMAGNPFGESWDRNNRLGDLRVDLGTYGVPFRAISPAKEPAHERWPKGGGGGQERP